MEKIACPHCGSPVGNDVTVCRECGKEVGDNLQPAPHAEQNSNKKIYGILAVFLVVVGGAALLLFTGLLSNPFKDRATAAIVNGQKISMQELDQKLEIIKKMYSQGGKMDFSSPQGKKALADMRGQVLNTMVQEKILVTESAKENITVSKQEIAERIASIKQAMNLSDKDFEDFLKNHAMSLENFEQRIEREAMINKLMIKGTQEKGLTKENWLKELNARARVEILAK